MNPSQNQDLERVIGEEQALIRSILTEMEKVIIGQRHLLERIVLALLSNGHVLIEGIPGLGKTLAVKTFSAIIQAKFQRVQFTPDMLPSDLTGSPVYIQQTGSFTVHKGPIFTNILLADEINRAPAKVQSALLEVMEERQVTIGQTTYALEEPFMVLATQNPIEQDGTYDLPESQLDRFLLKVAIHYPSRADEQRILRAKHVTQKELPVERIVNPAHILKIRKLVEEIHIEGKMENYILNIIEATRFPGKFKLSELQEAVAYGVSPRATQNLLLASKAQAFLNGRGYVSPDDVRNVARDVLGHRMILTTRAETLGLKREDVIHKILDRLGID
jgi:MoxR-like ATPase